MLKPATIATWQLRILGFTRIPLISYCWPEVIDISDNKIEVKIKLNRRTKNHLKTMYFGALSIGADITGGYLAMKSIRKMKSNISLIFKDFQADFLKRAEGDVHFICKEGFRIKELVQLTEDTGERQNMCVNIIAIVPSISNDVVAKFSLTLSLKKK